MSTRNSSVTRVFWQAICFYLLQKKPRQAILHIKLCNLYFGPEQEGKFSPESCGDNGAIRFWIN